MVRSATGMYRDVTGDGSISKGAWKCNSKARKCSRGNKRGNVNMRDSSERGNRRKCNGGGGVTISWFTIGCILGTGR